MGFEACHEIVKSREDYVEYAMNYKLPTEKPFRGEGSVPKDYVF